MPLPLASDLAAILNVEEFAVAASYQHVGDPDPITINVIFDNETVPIDAGGFVQVHKEQPRATCRTSDVPFVTEGDGLIISGTTFIIKAWVHDGTGVTSLQLEKQ